MSFAPLGLLAFLAACGPLEVYRYPDEQTNDDTDTDTTPIDIDVDNDGYTDAVDCDDTDATVNPGAIEMVDGLDNDCDSIVDEGTSAYDDDGDGYSEDAGDCDDTDGSVNPEADEVCNDVDDDCDGDVDDSTTNAWYLDYDSDGYGDPAYEYTDGCDGETYLVSNAEDCDDGDPAISPDADEICNDVDDNCDGSIDPSTSTDATAWFADEDGDSYGDVDEYVTACDQPSGYVADDTDCVDTDPRVYTGATEVCDELDNDCDLETDETDGNPDVLTLWDDADTDGYGDDSAGSFVACPADGFVEQGGDCDDGDNAISPDADEICDGLDNDCDGSTDPDDSIDASTWYTDADTDGYGDSASPVVACDMPEGAVEDATDCDDAEADVNPGEAEICNDVDDNCDGTTDVGASDAGTWYPDSDDDSYGNASGTPVTQCDQPSGYVDDSTDCDDTDGAISPEADEICDGLDNDCDGDTDPSTSLDASTWYTDADTDGFGDAASSSVSCLAPSGTVDDWTDCDDTDSSVYPDAKEYCDEQDNDCDGDIDEDVGETFYADSDGDGYGDSATTEEACEASSSYVDNDTDCDDTDGAISPEADEICDGLDNDCDGSIDPDDSIDASTWYTDADTDGYGDSISPVVACDLPEGAVDDDSDCDDGDATSYPGATEYCDGLDNDCDGSTDPDDSIDASTWYNDVDTDGYGDNVSPIVSCNAPTGTVENWTDCDDTDSSVYPGATEYCDTQDNDCDGDIDEDVGDTYYADLDGDGYGDSASPQEDCSDPDGYVSDASDCDDTDEYVNPDAIEVCSDELDNDCDEDVDSSPCVTEGSYEGVFTITLTETTYGLGSDSCEGTASLVVDTTASPMISGTVECAFTGSAATYLPDIYIGVVEGNFATDLLPSGSVDFTTFGWSFDWDDNGSNDDTVDGKFSGSDTYTVLGVPLDFDYTGDFATDIDGGV